MGSRSLQVVDYRAHSVRQLDCQSAYCNIQMLLSNYVQNISYCINENYYRSQTKLRKGKVSRSVCQEFCPQGGCVSQHALRQTPPVSTGRVVCIPACTGADTPLGRHPSWADTLPRQTPHPGRHPLGRHTPPDGHCSGRYASYWNAFLYLVTNSCNNVLTTTE